MRENFATTLIPLYKTENLHSETIKKIKHDLSNTDWINVNADSLTKKIEEVIIQHCEKRGAKEKNKDGNNFKSKNKIPRLVRLWMRRKIWPQRPC